ncbi:MAG: ABC transporter ATP-binding protein [Verrucomicrobia bacterium]|nr:ABC transporter ATP-binding protein [Verrucomicrobiota bacterium]
MDITLERITKRFGEQPVVKEVTLHVPAGSLFFLLGPSGCGKTTLLRMLAGFVEADEGTIRFGDREMSGVPAHERNTGMVFQNYALWPHLDVRSNVGYGLEVRKVPREEKDRRVQDALKRVRMEAYGERRPTQLSGGQQQRVALARALVIQPSLLLLDEPLSNLDARLRVELREEIRRIHAETGITTVYVTHDQKEALSLATSLAVMNRGEVVQVGHPKSIYRSPATRFVADFVGETNWLEGQVVKVEESQLWVATSLGDWRTTGKRRWAVGERVWLGFRPEAVRFGHAEENCFEAKVQRSSYGGEMEEYVLLAKGMLSIRAIEQNPDHARQIGTATVTHVPAVDTFVLPC